MKKRLSFLLLATGLFLAASTFTAFAGDDKGKCTKSESASCEKKDSKKAEAKTETKTETKTEAKTEAKAETAKK